MIIILSWCIIFISNMLVSYSTRISVEGYLVAMVRVMIPK